MLVFQLSRASKNAVIDVLKEETSKHLHWVRQRPLNISGAFRYESIRYPAIIVKASSFSGQRTDFQDVGRPLFAEAFVLGTYDVPRDNIEFGGRTIYNVQASSNSISYTDEFAITIVSRTQFTVTRKTTGETNIYSVVPLDIINYAIPEATIYFGRNIIPGETYTVITARDGLEIGTQLQGMANGSITCEIMAETLPEQEELSDLVYMTLWYTRRFDLQRRGLVIQEVSIGGESEVPEYADQIYLNTVNVNVKCEFSEDVYVRDWVRGIRITGELLDADDMPSGITFNTVVGAIAYLPNDVAAGAISLVLSTGDGAKFQENQTILLKDEVNNENVTIATINEDVLTLRSPLVYSYFVSNSAALLAGAI